IGGPRKVGEDRVRHVILPGPVRAADGSVYVPTELKALPVDEIDYHVQDDPSEDIHGAPMGARGASPDRSMVVSPNVRANSTALDRGGWCRSGTAITASGMNLVAAWNDGTNFSVSPGATGFGYSTDGGITWTDGGVPPVTTPVARHEGDPGCANDGAGNY